MLKIYHSKLMLQANQKCLQSIDASDQSQTHLIITPDRSTLITEQLLFETLKQNCFFNINVTTFTRFSNQVLSDLKLNNKKLLSKPSAVAIIKKIMLQNKDKLQAFKKAVDYSGVATSVFETMSMFKSCNIAPNQIDTNTKSTNLNNKLKDIALIYAEYEKFFEQEYTDSFNKLALTAQVLNQVSFKNTHFYFLGFNSFTPLQYDIITTLTKVATHVSVTTALNLQTDNNKNLFTNKTYYDLLSYADLNGLNACAIDANETLTEQKEHLKNNLFGYSYDKLNIVKAQNQLKIVNFYNIEQEIEFVTKTILSCVINGMNYNDFTIITPNINAYKNQIFNEFSKNNIPYFLDTNSTFNDTVFMRFYLKLFEAINTNFISSSVFGFLKTLHLVSSEKINEYENIVSASGLMGKVILQPLDLISLQPQIDLSDVYSLLAKVKELFMKTGGQHTVNHYINALNGFTKSVNFANTYEMLLQRLFEKNKIAEYKMHLQVPQKFEKALVELDEVLGSFECTFETFSQIFTTFFENVTLSLPPLENDTVFVADSVTSYVKPNKYIFVLGANAGTLPVSLDDLGIINDTEMSLMNNAKTLQPTVGFINKTNKYLLYEKMLSYKNELIITYLNSTAENEKLAPTAFVGAIKNMFTNQNGELAIEQNGVEVLDYGYLICENIEAQKQNIIFNTLSKNLLEQSFTNSISDYKYYVYNEDFKKRLNTFGAILKEYDNKQEKYVSNYTYVNTLEKIENANKLFFEKGSSSVSQFEKYFDCPFSHFVTYGLKLHEKKDADINPQDYGNIIHEYLRLLMPFVQQNKTHEQASKLVDNASLNFLNQVLSSQKYEVYINTPHNKNAIASLKQEARRIAQIVLEEQQVSTFCPKDSELEMRFGNFEKPIFLTADELKVKLTGVIDRIDTYDNMFRVVDYKTGGTAFNGFTDIMSGKKLQIFVYMHAYKHKTGLTPVAAFYLPLKNDYKTEGKEELYKFSGLITKDLAIMVNMDKNLLTPETKSKFINVKTSKDGSINGQVGRNQMVEQSDLEWLSNYTILLMQLALNKMVSGDITPNPLKQEDRYEYSQELIALSNFSESLGNTYRQVDKSSVLDKAKFVKELNGLLNTDSNGSYNENLDYITK